MPFVGRIGIGGRLFIAFGVVTAMTVAATIVGWISFATLSDGLNRVVGQNIPAVTAAARLAEKGGAIIGTAPALSAADGEQDRARVWGVLSGNLEDMNGLLERFDESVFDPQVHKSLADVVGSLAGNLRDLDVNVRRRIWLRNRKNELIGRLRWTSADFIDEVEPLIDDTRFNINLALERNPENRVLEAEMARQQALFRINAIGALLAELIGRAANLPDGNALQATELYFREIESRLEADLKLIESVPGAISLIQAVKDIRAFAEGQDSLFQLRLDEIEAGRTGRDLLALNRDHVNRLHSLIAERVQGENEAALRAASDSQGSIEQGKLLTAGAALVSFIVAGLIVWLYVGRNLVNRLARLDVSMSAIAQGDLKAEVPVHGADEIGDMADSLRTFRDTLSETQAELVQAAKLAALGQLTAGISHEVNQPLTAIRHYVRNAGILIDKKRPDEARSNLDKISEQTDRAIRIVTSLRDQARRPRTNLRTIDITNAVDNVLTLHGRRIRELNVETTTQFDDTACLVHAGQVRLEQVVMNLVGNALDAMAEAGCGSLTVSSHDAGDQVELRVADTGVGIKKGDLGRIFDPFFTTKDVGEGLGLGLSISYNIVGSFGGTIKAETNSGVGSTFRVFLDRAKGNDE